MSSQRREAAVRRRKVSSHLASYMISTETAHHMQGDGGPSKKTSAAGATSGTSEIKSDSPSTVESNQQPPEPDSVPHAKTPVPATKPLESVAKPPSSLPPKGTPCVQRVPKRRARAETWFTRSVEGPLLVYRTDLNILWWLVMGVAFLVRFWRLDYPCYVM